MARSLNRKNKIKLSLIVQVAVEEGNEDGGTRVHGAHEGPAERPLNPAGPEPGGRGEAGKGNSPEI